MRYLRCWGAPVGRIAVAALVAALASGCVDTVGQAQLQPAAAAKITAREGVSPAGATAAVIGVDGAPAAAAARFSAALASAAAARDIALGERAQAAYLLRFYLSAAPAEAGTTRLAYVFDMFDATHRRTLRLAGETQAAGRAGDPWAAADEAALRQLAERGADDMAAALSNTPEAVAAAARASTSIARTSPAPATPHPRAAQQIGLAAAR